MQCLEIPTNSIPNLAIHSKVYTPEHAEHAEHAEHDNRGEHEEERDQELAVSENLPSDDVQTPAGLAVASAVSDEPPATPGTPSSGRRGRRRVSSGGVITPAG